MQEARLTHIGVAASLAADLCLAMEYVEDVGNELSDQCGFDRGKASARPAIIWKNLRKDDLFIAYFGQFLQGRQSQIAWLEAQPASDAFAKKTLARLQAENVAKFTAEYYEKTDDLVEATERAPAGAVLVKDPAAIGAAYSDLVLLSACNTGIGRSVPIWSALDVACSVVARHRRVGPSPLAAPMPQPPPAAQPFVPSATCGASNPRGGPKSIGLTR